MKCLKELAVNFLFGFISEINEYIAAYNQVAISRISIFQEIVFPKLHSLFDFIGNLIGRTDLSEIPLS